MTSYGGWVEPRIPEVFTTPVVVELPTDESGKRWYRTTQPLNYHSDRYNKDYGVPADFKTDLASVPRLPIVFWLVGDRGSAAAVLHDWLYKNGVRLKQINTQEEADNLYYDALIDTKVEEIWACLMYYGVRLFGSAFFNHNGTGDSLF